MLSPEEKEEQAKLWARLETTQQTIDEYQSKFDSGQYHTYDGAMVLQQARTARRAILEQLKPLYLVWSHPFPDTLPEAEIPTRNEVRAFLSLPPLSDNEGGNEKVR